MAANPQLLIRVAANIDELRRNLQEGKVQVEAVSAGMQKFAASFSGDKLVQQAMNVTAAVREIGGAEKLTEAEMTRVNATLDRAITKLNALGKEAPPAMLALAEATKQVKPPLEQADATLNKIWTGLKGAAGLAGIAFSAQAVTSFVGSVFTAASSIHDMAEKLGVSAEAAQGFKFAAEQAGSSLDAVGASLNKMNLTLGQGSQSTIAALKSAGLSFDAIRQMKPEDAFLAITDAIQKIPDPMEQVRVGTALMGKGFSDLLPAIREGFRAAADGAAKMSNDTVNSLEAAQDAWEKLGNKVTIVTGNMIAQTMAMASHVTTNLQTFTGFLENAIKGGAGFAVAMAEADSVATKGFHDIYLAPPIKPFVELTEAQKKAAAAAEAHRLAIKALADAYSGATAIKAAADAMEAVNRNLRAGITVSQMTRDQQEALNKTLSAAIDAYRSIGKVAPESIRAIWRETMTLPPVVSGIAGAWKDLGEQIDVITPKVQAFGIAVTSGLPPDTFKILGDSIKPIAPEVHKSVDGIHELSQSIAQLAQISGGSFGGIVQSIGTMIAAIDTVKQGVGQIQAGRAQVASGGGTMSNIGGLAMMASGYGAIAMAAISAGKAIHAAMTDGRKAVKDFATGAGGFDELHARMLVLGAEGEALWIKLTQGTKKGDKSGAEATIAEINKALGAHDAVLNAVRAAGFVSSEELTKTAATAKQVYEYMRDAGTYSAADVQAAWEKSEEAQRAAILGTSAAQSEATTKAIAAIKAMDDEMKSLSDSIAGEAPEEFMGVVERQTRDRIAAIAAQRDAAQKELDQTTTDAADAAKEAGDVIDKALAAREYHVRVKVDLEGLPGWEGSAVSAAPSASALFMGENGGTNGRAASVTVGASSAPIVIHNITNLDGREIARNQVQHLPSILAGAGL